MTFSAIQWAYSQNLADARKRAVLVALAFRAGQDGDAWPSVAELAAMTKLDRKAVMTGLAKLTVQGLIEDTGKRVGNTGQIKVWKLILDQGALALGRFKQSRKRTPLNARKQSPIRDASEPSKESHMQDSFNGFEESLIRDYPESGTVPIRTPNSTESGTRKGKEPTLEEKTNVFLSSSGNPDEQCRLIFEAWNAVAKAQGLPIATTLNDTRKRSLKKRISEHGAAAVIQAIESIPKSQFLTGGGPDGWKAHFDFVLQPSSLMKLIEGAYFEAPPKPKRNRNSDEPRPYFEVLAEQRRKP